jgi:hypothetical protein
MKKQKITNAPYSGNKHADPNFNNNEYLKMVREAMKDLRANGVKYWRSFSEPRKSTGYRTKLWHAVHGTTTKKVNDLLKDNYPELVAKIEYGSHPIYGGSYIDVIITPKDKEYFMRDEIIWPEDNSVQELEDSTRSMEYPDVFPMKRGVRGVDDYSIKHYAEKSVGTFVDEPVDEEKRIAKLEKRVKDLEDKIAAIKNFLA